MIIVERKTGQSLVVNGEVFITVLRVEDDNIRLAFDMPENIEVKCIELIAKTNLKNLTLRS